jgi:exonuclease SbcC
MITSIELGDFLSHEKTTIDLEDGVTIFVGENGAGKSSIIDAITFSLFGKHTRKSNKGLIRRGNNQGYAKIKFSIKDKQYEAERKIDSKGSLNATLFEVTDNNRVQIAAGERKQFKESMTEQVEKIIGMSFEKLKIASIVQQGELNSIINAKPKEFKELLNAIIGIDKLDIASESMKKITKEFREKNRTESGYDDRQIDILKKMKQENQNKLDNAINEKRDLELQKTNLEKGITELEGEVRLEKEREVKIVQLKEKTSDLENYVDKEIKKINDEIGRNKGIIRNCEGCFEKLEQKAGFKRKLERATKEERDASEKKQKIKDQITSLKEQEKLAEKLQLKDNKCPVCNSVDVKLNPLFQNEHLKEELIKLKGNIESKEEERESKEEEIIEFTNELDKVRDAETILDTHKIKTEEQLLAIQSDIEVKEKKLQLADSENLEEIAQIDEHAKLIFEKISTLESETKGFDEAKFEEKIKELEESSESKEEERESKEEEIIEFTNELDKVRDAETILDTHKIKTEEQLLAIQRDIEVKEKKLQLADSENLEEIAQIDEHAKLIFEKISTLESETKGFDEAKFEEKIKELKEKRDDKANNDKNWGVVDNQEQTAKNAITGIKESILELEKVKDYISRLDNIQKHVFSRDGSVATSLRSWALNSISIKASEYLSVLNTKIQRIALSEKARDVSIACYSKTEVLELESLSGGEKVSVALALRLGMANLLGSSNLNLMILDEPTTHLDAERKKSLVEVLTQLSGIGKSQSAMQFLIITHDAEIFENEHVGQVHEFKSTEEGSKVTEL